MRVQVFPRWFVAGRKRYSAGASAATDDRGMYRIANLEPGDYAVGVPATWPYHTDGFAAHSSPEAFERDRDRQNQLTALGWTILRFTPSAIVRRPRDVYERILSVL